MPDSEELSTENSEVIDTEEAIKYFVKSIKETTEKCYKVFSDTHFFREIEFSYAENNAKYDVCGVMLPADLNILGYRDTYGYEHWKDVNPVWFMNNPDRVSSLPVSSSFQMLCIADGKGISDSTNYIVIEITDEPYETYGIVHEKSTEKFEYNGYTIRASEIRVFQVELPNNKYLNITIFSDEDFAIEEAFDLIRFDNTITGPLVDITNPLELLYDEESVAEYKMYDGILGIKIPETSQCYTENGVFNCSGDFGSIKVEVNNDVRYHPDFDKHIESDTYPITYEVTKDKDTEELIVRIWAIDDVNTLTGYEEYVEVRYTGKWLHATDATTLAGIIAEIININP